MELTQFRPGEDDAMSVDDEKIWLHAGYTVSRLRLDSSEAAATEPSYGIEPMMIAQPPTGEQIS